jgi:hypothetical protein
MKLALEALIGAIEAAKTDVAHYAALDFDMCEDALQRGYAALEALAKQEQRNVTKDEHDVLMKALAKSGKVVDAGSLAKQEQGEPVTADEKLARMKSELAYMRGQQEQGEPYGYLKLNTGKFVNEVEGLNPMKDKRYLPLYDKPQQRTWVGLTDEEREQVYKIWRFHPSNETNLHLCKAIEAKLKEKNGA